MVDRAPHPVKIPAVVRPLPCPRFGRELQSNYGAGGTGDWDMHTAHWLKTAVIAGALATGLGSLGGAYAHELPADFVLACDNGHHYPIRARAVSVTGDLVTG